MGRFPIRIQVMFLASAFIATLVVLSIISWTVKSELTGKLYQASGVFAEAKLLNDITQRTQNAQLAMMLFIAGDDAQITQLREQAAAAVEGLGRVPETFRRGGAAGEYVADLAEMQARFKIMDALVEELAGLTLFDRKAFAYKQLLPEMEAVRRDLLTMHAALAEDVARLERDAAAVAAASDIKQLVGNGVVVALALVLAFVFGRSLSLPIRRARDAVVQLADHDYAIEIRDTQREDEVGMISRSLEELRGKLAAADAAEQTAQQENARRVALFQAVGTAMGHLRDGALDSRLEASEWADLGDTYVQLCRDFNGLAAALQELVSSLRSSADTVKGNAQELFSMSDEMSRRSEVQAATLEQSAAALDELSASVQSASERAQDVDTKVSEGRQRAEQGGEVMARALQAMGSIAKSSEQIAQIITVIDDIAFQTNLLALNAGVEAARAGESGKGFSVVASEVRGLAQRASESASEIKELVLNSSRQVEDGEKLVQETSATLNHIVASVTEVSEMVSDIATSAKDQAGGVREINVGVAELDKVTQQNAAMVSQTNAASQQLSVEATRLSEVLARFSGSADPAGDASSGFVNTESPHRDGALTADAGDGRRMDDQASTGWQANIPGQTPDGSPDLTGADKAAQDQRDRLVHGSWSDEMDEPEPLRMEPAGVAIGDDRWKDF